MMVRQARFLRFGRYLTFAALLALSLTLAGFPPAQAALQVRVDQGVTEPIPLAIPDVRGAGQTGSDHPTVSRADLERSGLFRSLNPASFIERITDINSP